MTPRSREVVATGVWLVHLLLTIFMITVWMIPWKWAAWVGIFFLPLVVLHWKTNRNRCVLTLLEQRLREGNLSKLLPKAQEQLFIRELLRQIFGVNWSPEVVNGIIYFILVFVWMICFCRILFSFHIS